MDVTEVCKEIISKARGDKDSVFVDFRMSKGKMSGKGEENTWIKFDVHDSPLLKEMLKKMVESDDPSDEDVKTFDEWRKEVARHMAESFSVELKEVVCDAMFSGSKDMPFKIISADFELTDIPTNDKVVVVRKASPPGVVTPPVVSEIMRIHEETGESFERIVNAKKASGDPRYQWIVGVDTRKSFFEANLSVAVDYSLEEEKG